MIRRHYAYSLVLQDNSRPKFMCGVVCHQSWFPDPQKAWQRVVVGATNTWSCEVSKVRVESFTRV